MTCSFNKNKNKDSGSGCGSVGRAGTSDTRGLWFESSHWQIFINIEHFVYCQLCIEKTKIKKKRPGMAHLKKTKIQLQNSPS